MLVGKYICGKVIVLRKKVVDCNVLNGLYLVVVTNHPLLAFLSFLQSALYAVYLVSHTHKQMIGDVKPHRKVS
jgi:hypothetical protein